jgi:hypothetical protein
MKRDPSSLLKVAGTVGLLLVANAAARPAAADRDALEFRVAELNKLAIYQLEEKQWEGARKRLVEAERLARERGGAVGEALLARTHLHLGAMVVLAGADLGQARAYFRRALCRQRNIRPTGRVVARPEVVRLFDEVRDTYRGPHRGCPVVVDFEERDLPVRVQALDCPNQDEAVEGTDFVVGCVVNARLPVARVILDYRPPAKEEFVPVEMRRTARGWWTAAVPAKAVQGKSFAYFFEGRNAAGKTIVINGDKDEPNFALIMGAGVCGCD